MVRHNHNHSHNHNNHYSPPSRNQIPNRPTPETVKRPGLRERIRNKISPPPATDEEIMQLKKDAEREKLRTDIATYKHERPRSGFSRVLLGSGQEQRQQVQRQVRPKYVPKGNMGRSIIDDNRPSVNAFGMGRSLLDSNPDVSGVGSGLSRMLGQGSYQQPPKKTRQPKQQPPQRSGLEKMFSTW